MTDATAINPEDELKGPLWLTFACHLPYRFGIEDGATYTIPIPGRWIHDDVYNVFGPPVVRIRLRNQPMPTLAVIPPETTEVLGVFYGEAGANSPEGQQVPWPPEEGVAYDQWVSLETPNVLLDWEQPDDPPYAFHRCLTGLRYFVMALQATVGRPDLYPPFTRDLGEVVFRGAYTTDGEWHPFGSLLMHMEAWPAFPKPQAAKWS